MSQRKRFLVDPEVQYALIRRTLMHWSVAMLTWMAIGVIVHLTYASDGSSLQEAIAASFTVQIPLLCVLFMLMPIYVWDMIKLSHRFVGPMHRLRTVFRDLANGGRAPRIRLRAGDFWHEAAEDFNAFYQSHLDLKQRCEQLEKELARATAGDRQPSPVEV
jgi:hypothetical protein